MTFTWRDAVHILGGDAETGAARERFVTEMASSSAMTAKPRPIASNMGKKTRLFMGGLLSSQTVENKTRTSYVARPSSLFLSGDVTDRRPVAWQTKMQANLLASRIAIGMRGFRS